MSDQNVKAAQKYLNAMFGGHKDWVKLDEDGKTGTAVMQGIIRAFQIQNGISTITGTVGPLTINTMKKLAIITKMDPNDTPQVNVCLIQCALFCKGYAAGGITGIYYTSGVNAVKKMQENAGLEVTGKIDWKVWSGLLSLNWFTKVSGGDSNIVLAFLSLFCFCSLLPLFYDFRSILLILFSQRDGLLHAGVVDIFRLKHQFLRIQQFGFDHCP